MSVNPVGDGPIATSIREKLEEFFRPVELVVTDQSDQHAGHAGAKGFSGESHFHVRIVSERFRDLPRVARAQVVHEVLQEEIPRIHALSLDLHEPDGAVAPGKSFVEPDPDRDPDTGKAKGWSTKDTTKSTAFKQPG